MCVCWYNSKYVGCDVGLRNKCHSCSGSRVSIQSCLRKPLFLSGSVLAHGNVESIIRQVHCVSETHRDKSTNPHAGTLKLSSWVLGLVSYQDPLPRLHSLV